MKNVTREQLIFLGLQTNTFGAMSVPVPWGWTLKEALTAWQQVVGYLRANGEPYQPYMRDWEGRAELVSFAHRFAAGQSGGTLNWETTPEAFVEWFERAAVHASFGGKEAEALIESGLEILGITGPDPAEFDMKKLLSQVWEGDIALPLQNYGEKVVAKGFFKPVADILTEYRNRMSRRMPTTALEQEDRHLGAMFSFRLMVGGDSIEEEVRWLRKVIAPLE